MSQFYSTLQRLLSGADIPYQREMLEVCEAYFRLLERANKTINLTRILDETQAAQMHFFGAMQLLAAAELPQGASVVDIGTGAGFPGIPLKIMRPDIALTLIDATAKKIDFIRSAAEKIGLDVTTIAARSEETVRDGLRESFDFAVSRAVASLPALAELCLPYVRVGGVFAAWKGEQYKKELAQAGGAIDVLGGGSPDIYHTDPGAIILIAKQKPTPDKYPRRFSKIKIHPL